MASPFSVHAWISFTSRTSEWMEAKKTNKQTNQQNKTTKPPTCFYNDFHSNVTKNTFKSDLMIQPGYYY